MEVDRKEGVVGQWRSGEVGSLLSEDAVKRKVVMRYVEVEVDDDL